MKRGNPNIYRTNRSSREIEIPPSAEWDFTCVSEPFLGSAVAYEYICSSKNIRAVTESWFCFRLDDPNTHEETDTTVGCLIGRGLPFLNDCDRELLNNSAPFSFPFLVSCVAIAPSIIQAEPWEKLRTTQKTELEKEYCRYWQKNTKPFEFHQPGSHMDKCVANFCGDIDWDYSDNEI